MAPRGCGSALGRCPAYWYGTGGGTLTREEQVSAGWSGGRRRRAVGEGPGARLPRPAWSDWSICMWWLSYIRRRKEDPRPEPEWASAGASQGFQFIPFLLRRPLRRKARAEPRPPKDPGATTKVSSAPEVLAAVSRHFRHRVLASRTWQRRTWCRPSFFLPPRTTAVAPGTPQASAGKPRLFDMFVPGPVAATAVVAVRHLVSQALARSIEIPPQMGVARVCGWAGTPSAKT